MSAPVSGRRNTVRRSSSATCTALRPAPAPSRPRWRSSVSVGRPRAGMTIARGHARPRAGRAAWAGRRASCVVSTAACSSKAPPWSWPTSVTPGAMTQLAGVARSGRAAASWRRRAPTSRAGSAAERAGVAQPAGRVVHQADGQAHRSPGRVVEQPERTERGVDDRPRRLVGAAQHLERGLRRAAPGVSLTSRSPSGGRCRACGHSGDVARCCRARPRASGAWRAPGSTADPRRAGRRRSRRRRRTAPTSPAPTAVSDAWADHPKRPPADGRVERERAGGQVGDDRDGRRWRCGRTRGRRRRRRRRAEERRGPPSASWAGAAASSSASPTSAAGSCSSCSTASATLPSAARAAALRAPAGARRPTATGRWPSPRRRSAGPPATAAAGPRRRPARRRAAARRSVRGRRRTRRPSWTTMRAAAVAVEPAPRGMVTSTVTARSACSRDWVGPRSGSGPPASQPPPGADPQLARARRGRSPRSGRVGADVQAAEVDGDAGRSTTMRSVGLPRSACAGRAGSPVAAPARRPRRGPGPGPPGPLPTMAVIAGAPPARRRRRTRRGHPGRPGRRSRRRAGAARRPGRCRPSTSASARTSARPRARSASSASVSGGAIAARKPPERRPRRPRRAR